FSAAPRPASTSSTAKRRNLRLRSEARNRGSDSSLSSSVRISSALIDGRSAKKSSKVPFPAEAQNFASLRTGGRLRGQLDRGPTVTGGYSNVLRFSRHPADTAVREGYRRVAG